MLKLENTLKTNLSHRSRRDSELWVIYECIALKDIFQSEKLCFENSIFSVCLIPYKNLIFWIKIYTILENFSYIWSKTNKNWCERLRILAKIFSKIVMTDALAEAKVKATETENIRNFSRLLFKYNFFCI